MTATIVYGFLIPTGREAEVDALLPELAPLKKIGPCLGVALVTVTDPVMPWLRISPHNTLPPHDPALAALGRAARILKLQVPATSYLLGLP